MLKNHHNFFKVEGVAGFCDRPTDRRCNVVNFQTQETELGPRILLCRKAVKKALSSLVGMALCCKPETFQAHSLREKCGLITEAWLDGDAIRVSGGVYALDFPDVAEAVQQRELGLCVFIRDVEARLLDGNADPKTAVAEMGKLLFTGAAILEKAHCDWSGTWVKAEAAPEPTSLLPWEKPKPRGSQERQPSWRAGWSRFAS